MTTPEETPEQRVTRYEAGAIPGDGGPAGFWWNLLQAEPEVRFRMVARCTEEGWIGPNNVRYLATVLELPEGAGWDDVTAAVRALKAASQPDPDPGPGDPGVPAREV